MVSLPQVKEEQWTFVLQFYLDNHGIPSLDKASINEVYYEEVPIKSTTTAKPTTQTTTTTSTTEQTEGTTQQPENPPAEEKKTEKVKKDRSTLCIKKEVDNTFIIPKTNLDNMVQREANQENDDRLLHLAINKRNEIENFIYSTRGKLDSELTGFINEADKATLLKLMQEMEDWLYSGDEEVYLKSRLEERGKALNDLGSALYGRFHGWNKLEESLSKLEQILNLNVNKYNEEYDKVSKGLPTNLNKNDVEELSKHIQHYNNYLNEGKASYTKGSRLLDPQLKWQDVDKTSEEFVKVRIF
jgi:heat shock protein 4